MLRILIEMALLRQFQWVPTSYVLVEKEEKYLFGQPSCLQFWSPDNQTPDKQIGINKYLNFPYFFTKTYVVVLTGIASIFIWAPLLSKALEPR